MKKWFNITVYERAYHFINNTKNKRIPPHQAMTLYDAIRFYAIAVNDTLANNEDYRDGRPS